MISQIAKQEYGVPKVVARVNDPRNQSTSTRWDLADRLRDPGILGLVEHEVPEHGLVQLLELQRKGSCRRGPGRARLAVSRQKVERIGLPAERG